MKVRGDNEEGKLAALKKALKDVIEDVHEGKLTQLQAADEITSIREALDAIILDLKSIDRNSDR